MDATLEQTLRDIFASTRTIAVVGATPDRSKPGGSIPGYLESQGYRIVPVTSFHNEVLGERTYSDLSDVDVPADIVSVFRPAAEAPGIVRSF